MDFVDEQHRARLSFQFGDDGLQPLLEIAAVAGAGQQRAHVEGENRALGEHLRHVALHDAFRQALGNGGFANAGIAHVERVVLGAPAEDLDRALHLGVAADERVDLAGHRLLVEVHAIGAQRILVAPVRLLLPLAFGVFVWRGRRAACGRPLGGAAGRLGDAVADEIDRVQPGHVLQLQEIDGVAFAFGEQGDEHVRPRHLVAAARLHMDGGALHHALEAGGGLRLGRAVGGEAREVLIQKLGQVLAQLVEIDAAGAQHGCRVAVVGQAEQQMFEGCIFVPPVAGEGQGAVEGLF